MDNIKDIVFMPEHEFEAENPVTHALLEHLIVELEKMNKHLDSFELLTEVCLAAAAYTFYRSGGSSEEFIEKLQSVNIFHYLQQVLKTILIFF